MARNARAKQELLNEADKIKKDLTSGKITGKKTIQAAKYKMYNLRYRASKANEKTEKVEEPVVVKKAQKISKVKAKASKLANSDQGILPGFLPQMNIVRVEELVADKIFNAIKKGEMTATFSADKKAV